MTITNDNLPDTPVVRQASRNRTLLAFLITSIALFLAIGLTWPLTMGGYQSEGMIEFDNQELASLLANNALPSALKSVMNPDAMANRLAQVRSNTGSRSPIFEAGNIEEIHRRISIGFRDASQYQKSRLRIVYSGSGTADEVRFIRSFTSDVARRLDYAANSIPGQNSIATKTHPVDQAHWLVDQIEEGLTSARSQTAQLMAYSQATNHQSAFRNVGHVREPAKPNVDSLHQTLESVDVASLRGVITQLKTDNGTLKQSGLVRFDAESVANRPLGAIPSPAAMLFAALLSIVFGGVVALNIHPFEEPGFENVDDVTEKLGVPVIGSLENGQSLVENHETPWKTNWANQTVRICGTVIAVIAILGIVFWLTSSEVRTSFGESWFHGFARIVWNLAGA